MPRVVRRDVSFIVENLIVPRTWRVGRARIRPAGDLLRRIDARMGPKPSKTQKWLALERQQELGSSKWATIEIPILTPVGTIDNAAIDAARDVARDTIAVLRFFQRRLLPYFSLDIQTFGLAADIGGVIEPRWVTDRIGRYAGGGWQRHGIAASWTFTLAQLRTYRADPRFLYLDAALRARSPDDWQSRFLTTLRTMNIATIRERPSIRIMLFATALEALVGDPYEAGGGSLGNKGHKLAQRAAYFSCGSDPGPVDLHRPGGRPACEFLTRRKDPRGDPTLYYAAGHTWACSEYGDMRDLYDDRNAALHGAAAGFDQRRASSHQFHLDRVVREALTWVIHRKPKAISDLDAEISAMPAA